MNRHHELLKKLFPSNVIVTCFLVNACKKPCFSVFSDSNMEKTCLHFTGNQSLQNICKHVPVGRECIDDIDRLW